MAPGASPPAGPLGGEEKALHLPRWCAWGPRSPLRGRHHNPLTVRGAILHNLATFGRKLALAPFWGGLGPRKGPILAQRGPKQPFGGPLRGPPKGCLLRQTPPKRGHNNLLPPCAARGQKVALGGPLHAEAPPKHPFGGPLRGPPKACFGPVAVDFINGAKTGVRCRNNISPSGQGPHGHHGLCPPRSGGHCTSPLWGDCECLGKQGNGGPLPPKMSPREAGAHFI